MMTSWDVCFWYTKEWENLCQSVLLCLNNVPLDCAKESNEEDTAFRDVSVAVQ